jgi:hypothetical protein
VNIPEQREEHGSAFLDPGDALNAAPLCLDLDALVHGGSCHLAGAARRVRAPRRTK